MRSSISMIAGFFLALRLAIPGFPISAQGNAPPVSIQRLSTGLDGGMANGDSSDVRLSSDGRFAAFSSTAYNLTANDRNSAADIFLFDRQSGKLTLVSTAAGGNPANAASSEPALSADGRYIAFTSLATDLVHGDTNGLPDVFVYDRLKKTSERVSISSDGTQAQGWSHQPSISGDGRFVAFSSTADNLVPSDSHPASALFVRDRQTGQTRRVSDSTIETSHPTFSSDGRYLAFLSSTDHGWRIGMVDLLTGQSSLLPLPLALSQGEYSLGYPALSADGRYSAFSAWDGRSSGIYLYDRTRDTLQRIADLAESSRNGGCLSLSADGRYLAFEGPQGILVYDQTAEQTQHPAFDLDSPKCPFLSASGRSIAFVVQSDALVNVYLADLGDARNSPALISGWVSDGQGHAMAGVRISDGAGQELTTAADGNFSLSTAPGRSYRVEPEKKGYSFSPSSRPVALTSAGAVGLSFIASPDAVLEEAGKDIGMPYSLTRGCASPFSECGGPFHGFYSGDCTDLVLDAYLEAADYNIQLALERDFRLNPRHYYRWRDARSAQDMWRFFAYSGLVLPPDEAYLPGDIVFFDWQGDGTIDHVAMVSKVNSRGRPRKMIDASGKTADNPSGLAAELPWKPFHSAQTPGHARWLGAGRPPASPKSEQILVIALDSPTVQLRLLDSSSRLVSATELKIPGSTYLSTGVGSVISVDEPLKTSAWYFIELSSPVQAAYQLGVQAIQSGVVSAHRSVSLNLAVGETRMIAIYMKAEGEKLVFELPGLSP